jgi:hypothetical protein
MISTWSAALAAAAIAAPGASSAGALTPRGAPVAIACSGPAAVEGRKLAKAEDLKLGLDPAACFGRMQIYDGPNRQLVVVAPSPKCPGGKALDVFEASKAGPWRSFFENPVCGSTISVGPKDPWGDWMLTIDGQHYDSRGAYYVPAK